MDNYIRGFMKTAGFGDWVNSAKNWVGNKLTGGATGAVQGVNKGISGTPSANNKPAFSASDTSTAPTTDGQRAARRAHLGIKPSRNIQPPKVTAAAPVQASPPPVRTFNQNRP